MPLSMYEVQRCTVCQNTVPRHPVDDMVHRTIRCLSCITALVDLQIFIIYSFRPLITVSQLQLCNISRNFIKQTPKSELKDISQISKMFRTITEEGITRVMLQTLPLTTTPTNSTGKMLPLLSLTARKVLYKCVNSAFQSCYRDFRFGNHKI